VHHSRLILFVGIVANPVHSHRPDQFLRVDKGVLVLILVIEFGQGLGPPVTALSGQL
jgi:hypothetical protein